MCAVARGEPLAERTRSEPRLLLLARDRHVQALVAITAVAAALRFATLAGQSFWFDEVVTVSLVRKSLSGMLSALPGSESTPPTYYVLAWLWSRVFGTGEFALRSLSALAGTLTIPVAYAAGAALVSRRIGLLVAALAATSPFLIWYSQEARAYGLVVLFGSLSFLFFVRAFRRPTSSHLVWWAVFSILAFATHYFAAFTVITEAAALLLVRVRRRSVLLSIGVVGLAGLALLPLAAHQDRVGGASWISAIPLDLRMKEVVRLFTTPASVPFWAGSGIRDHRLEHLWWIGVVLLAFAGLMLLLLGGRRERGGASVALGIGSATLMMPIVLGGLGHALSHQFDYVIGRNVITAWLPIAVFVAAGLGVRRARSFGVAAVAALCAAAVILDVVVATNSTWQRDDWRLIARHLAAEPHAVFVKPQGFARALRYYDHALKPLPPRGVRLTELDVLLQWNRRGQAVTVPAGFGPAGTERLQNWALVRFRSAAPMRVRPGELGPVTEVLLPASPQPT